MLTLDHLPSIDWHARAHCSVTGSPTDWDTPTDRRPRHEKLATTAAQCTGCPVVVECAADALEERSIGVIRAGVPLVHHDWQGRRGPVVADTMACIAAGVAPARALASILCTLEEFAEARPELMAMATAAGDPVPAHGAWSTGATARLTPAPTQARGVARG